MGRVGRDPLLTLGCADPVDRILAAKASDPQRLRVAELFETWYQHHHDSGRAARDLHDDVKNIADPAGRGRQFLATYLDKLTGTRAAGFVLLQHKPAGKWGATVYSLKVTDEFGNTSQLRSPPMPSLGLAFAVPLLLWRSVSGGWLAHGLERGLHTSLMLES